MNQIKESFTNFVSKTKNKFFSTIDKTKFLEQEFKWNLINFIVTCATLIAAITSIVTTTSSTDKSVTLGLVYGFYLPFALANCILSVIVALCCVKKDTKSFWKQWYFYMPLTIIFIEAVILPIPLNLITWAKVNGGMMWSIIIFAFLAVFAAFAIFIWIYKETLTDQTYVLADGSEDNKPSGPEKKEAKTKDDDKKMVVDPVKEQEAIQQPIEKAITLPYVGQTDNIDPDFTVHYDEVNDLETNVDHQEDKKGEITSSSSNSNNDDDNSSSSYNNNTF